MSAAVEPAARVTRRVEHCMGTVFSFDVRTPGIDPAVLDDVVDWLHRVDATFSTYRPESEISRLGRGELHRADCSPDVRHVLDRCDELHRLTDGYFDMYAGGRLDPSGYVKGWAIERASDQLLAAGAANHCVNGGGDVQCAGRPAPEREWSVGIADPADATRVIATVSGSRLAVATSGSAQRGAHIVNPRGPAPAEYVSVTVVGERLAEVDAEATAAFAMGAGAADWLRARGRRALLVAAGAGRPILVDPVGQAPQ